MQVWATGTILDGNSSGRFFRDYINGRYEEDGYGVLYKVYAGVDEETGEVILRYCNKERYPDKEIRVRELVVQGVAKHVIKALG